jgi:hypothetical protein
MAFIRPLDSNLDSTVGLRKILEFEDTGLSGLLGIISVEGSPIL